jgi:hypothetical protein
MPVTPQPSQETYYYKEVRRTQPGPGVVYPGYPIFHLYKRNLASNNPDARDIPTNKIKTITHISRVIFPIKIKTVTGVSRAVADVATITVGADHQFQIGDMVTVFGLTNTSYNGDHELTAVDETTISYANTGDIQALVVDNGTAATGTKHATITVGSGHQFQVGDNVTVSGLTNTAYNGDHVLTAVGSATISYANTGAIQSLTADSGTAAINIEYWLPLPSLTSYKEYTPGDENVPAQRTVYEPRTEIGVRRGRRHYTDRFSVYTHKYSGTKLFVATNRTKLYPLPETRLAPTNPYSYRNIQVWIESPETYTNTYDSNGNLIVPSYWYHPFQNRFYPFGNLETFGFTDSQYLIDSLFTRDTSGQSNASLLANAADSIRLAKIDELISRGITRAEAIAFVNANAAAALSTRAANSLIMPSARIARQVPRSQNLTVNVPSPVLSRTITPGQTPAPTQPATALARAGRRAVTIPATINPKLVQTTTSGQPQLTYEFLHRPNQISYTSIGSEWSPIDRAANRPMVDWKSYKLMSVSFSFIVAPNADGSLDASLDNNVITTSVDNDLKTLRQMASSPFPVVFMGFDKLLQEPVRYPFNKDSGNSSLFIIADFSVSSIYRSSTGAISRASCDITLTEYPKELIKLIEFPKLKPLTEIPVDTPGGGPGGGCSGNLATNTIGLTGEGLTPAFIRRLVKRGFITYNSKCATIRVVPGKEKGYLKAKTLGADWTEGTLWDIADTGGFIDP